MCVPYATVELEAAVFLSRLTFSFEAASYLTAVSPGPLPWLASPSSLPLPVLERQAGGLRAQYSLGYMSLF